MVPGKALPSQDRCNDLKSLRGRDFGSNSTLKPKFAESQKIFELSHSFIMVNVEVRIPVFIVNSMQQYVVKAQGLTNPTGKVHPEITNRNGNPNYKYFYSNAEQVVSGMKEALEKLTGDAFKESHMADEL
ncbi:UNVERIFIED_CONTAM: hypothetical protein FKN15_040356 [Acipenser sinensis]